MRDSDYIRFTIYLLSHAQQQAQYIAQKELLKRLVYNFADMLARNCVGFNRPRFVDECMREQLGSQYDPYSDIANLAASTGWVGPEAGNRPNAAPPPLAMPLGAVPPAVPPVARRHPRSLEEERDLSRLYPPIDMSLGRVIRPGGTATGRLQGNLNTFAPIEEPEGEANGPEEGPTTEQA